MPGAVFSDVEGTLVDANLPRLSVSLGRKMGYFSRWQVAQLGMLALLGKVLPGKLSTRMRLASVTRAMAGQREPDVHRLVEAVLPEVLSRIKPGSLARLKAHQSNGLPLVLMSGGPHELITRLGDELGGRGEGTRYVKWGGRYLAKLDGPACQGEGKAARARSICKQEGYDLAASYAYGDTGNDIPLLNLFGHPHAVDPDEELAAEATLRGWPIIRSGGE
ncbi:MAG: HAD family phosphatase [Chloroflexota bacterium]